MLGEFEVRRWDLDLDIGKVGFEEVEEQDFSFCFWRRARREARAVEAAERVEVDTGGMMRALAKRLVRECVVMGAVLCDEKG